MRFLLDTNVVSEIRRHAPDAGVSAWWKEVPASRLYLSVLTVGEIQRGIELIRHREDTTQAERLTGWLSGLTTQFADRILDVDTAVTMEWARQARRDRRGQAEHGRSVPVIDGLLAATAIVHDLTLVSRNIRDLERTDARLLNPFQSR